MVTIRRYPVPPDSYNPDGPLNDLMRSQLDHFVHVAKLLPQQLQVTVPVPSGDDAAAANRFVAAVTEQLMSVKKPLPRLVRKRATRSRTPGLALAASAETPKSPRPAPKKKTGAKSKTKGESK